MGNEVVDISWDVSSVSSPATVLSHRDEFSEVTSEYFSEVTSDSLLDLEKSQIKKEGITPVALCENVIHLVGVLNTDQKRGYSVRSLLSCFKDKS